jgi:NTP pyrophosphatase (non-canonical NTP hydrolase)
MTIKEWQGKIDEWIKTYGVRYFDPMTNTVVLMEEVGEFARLMARKYGEQSFKDPKDEETADEKIKEELSDVLFVLTCLANQMDIDIESALMKNFEKKSARDKNRHHNNPKLGVQS